MPWSASDGPARHTHKADTPKKRRQWADVANSALARGEPEGTAVREANGVLDRRTKSHRHAVKHGHTHPASHSEFERLGS